ncbi:MAG: FAD-dependent oxidoreductase [Nitrososphaeria archaeon]|nr:FAD-dependent oxidoreductase [Nitrososphaeria archaeon]
MSLRLEEPLISDFSRGKEVKFSIDGREIKAYSNETVAVALLASRRRILMRSVKFHRPRGNFCFRGRCARCLMKINGIPNVRACDTLVRNEMTVESQNAYPDVQTDILSIFDKFSNYFTAGLQYHKFIRPKFLQQLYLNMLGRFIGLGTIPEKTNEKELKPYMTKKTDIAIIGGGPAGISAAIHTSNPHIETTLIDENDGLGGNLNFRKDEFVGITDYEETKNYEVVKKLIQELKEAPNIEVLTNAVVEGYYGNGEHTLGIVSDKQVIKLHAKRIVIVTGSYDAAGTFENNDLPGVYSARGIEKLLNVYGVKPGNDAVMLGGGSLALRVSKLMLEAGINVQGIVTKHQKLTLNSKQSVELPIINRAIIERARGRKEVKGVTIVDIDESGNVIPRTRRNMNCDVIGISYLQPTYELQFQIGCKLSYDPGLGGFVALHDDNMQTSIQGVFVAGDAAGIKSPAGSIIEGRIAGLSSILSLGVEDIGKEDLRRAYIKMLPKERLETAKMIGGKRRYVCFCEDVNESEIVNAIHQGYSHIEMLKRYTGVSTGSCQGKFCLISLIEILAKETGKSFDEVGVPTQRPPIKPVYLSDLASEDVER